MKRLSGYLFRTIFGSILVVLTIVIGVDLLAEVIDETRSMRADYNFAEVLLYALLKVPGTLYEMLPFAALIGCLVGLGSLANNSELTVMRAAGVSSARVAWMVMRPALVLIVAGLLIGDFVAPQLDQMAESRRDLLRQTGVDQASNTSIWVADGDQFVHAETVFPNGVLFGVSRYRFSEEGDLVSVSNAFRAEFTGDGWREENVRVTEFGIERTDADLIAERLWETRLTPRLLNALVLEPEQLSLRDLYEFTDSLQALTPTAGLYELAFWSKALQPLAVAALVVVAISFVFGSVRVVSMGQRIFTGVLVGVVFQMGQKMLAPASIVYGFSALVAVLLPILFVFLLGAMLIWARR